MFKSLIIITACLTFTDAPDTLETATVVADRGVIVSRTDTLDLSDAISITDVLESVPGLYVGDCGGSAGLKTVSLRGMGSAHTAIYIDGVRVSNIQSGQPDMGMPGTDGFSSITVDYAQNSISFTTERPQLNGRKLAGDIIFRAGSFGTYEPYGRLDVRLTDKVVLSAFGSGVSSRGDFPVAAGGTRTNNDIRQLRGGLDLWGLIDGGDWHAKAFCNGAERGTPGTVEWPSEDRQVDRNAFVQGVMRKSFSPCYSMTVSARAAYDMLHYFSEWGDSDYAQSGLQINSSHGFKVCSWLNLSATADIQYDKLESSLYEGARTGAVAAAAASVRSGRFKSELAIEYDGIFDRGEEARHAISPSVSMRCKVAEGLDITAFGRRSFRIPTFNELYYPGYGNPELRAERAWLSDLGMEYCRDTGRCWEIRAKADAFFNLLDDKIISAPTPDDPNIWLPYNIGSVRMCGSEFQLGAAYAGNGWKASATARYSFLSAVDDTPDSSTYGSQIPFSARHSSSAVVSVSGHGWNMQTSWTRRAGRNDSVGAMPDWSTADVSAGKHIAVSGIIIGVKLAARNIFDCRYELSGGYPMPGRSFTGGIEIKF